MPGMDGWETFQRLRDRSSVLVLFLTALDFGEFAARAFALGANDFVRKPFYTEELLARVDALLGDVQTHPTSPAADVLNNWVVKVRPTVSVIIPTLNEAKNLPLVLPYLPMDLIERVLW